MEKHKHLVKIIIIGIVVIVLALIISMMVNLKSTAAPVGNINPHQDEMNGEESGTSTSMASSSLNKITPSSSVRSDMDAYIDSANSAPNPNDFNDSYSDLNQ